MSNLDIAKKYATDCITGVIPACVYVKQACSRFINDLERSDLEYRENEVNKVVKFLKNLELINVDTTINFNPQPWQLFIISNIYGFFLKNSIERKYRYNYIEISRKNGKSFFINALAFYHFIYDNYASVLVKANSREQAKDVDMKILNAFSAQIDPDREQIKTRYNSIIYGNNVINVLSDNVKALDGYNPSIIVLDEYAAATSIDGYNILKSGFGARENPLMYVITTAGFNTDGPCYQLRNYNASVLASVTEDDSTFSIIYTIDDGESIQSEHAVIKANPNINISVKQRFFSDEIKKALQNPDELAGVEVKNFNRWQSSSFENKYIDEKYITKAFNNNIKLSDFINNQCIAGFDLGSTNDITAVAFLFEKDKVFNFFVKYYIPADSLGTAHNKILYQQWASKGYLTVTQGNVTDYDYVTSDLIKMRNDNFSIQSIHYDSHNATQMAVNLTTNNFYLLPFSQTVGNFNAPTKLLKEMIMSGKVNFEKNPITQWMLSNCVLKIDKINGNIKPIQQKLSLKIDGIIASIMCVGGRKPVREIQVY
jgi:phage terminase large subunit-like protein